MCKKKIEDDYKTADGCSSAGGEWNSTSAVCFKGVDSSWIGKNPKDYDISISALTFSARGVSVCNHLNGDVSEDQSLCTLRTSQWEFKAPTSIGRTRIRYWIASPSQSECGLFGSYAEGYENGKCVVVDTSEMPLTFIKK